MSSKDTEQNSDDNDGIDLKQAVFALSATSRILKIWDLTVSIADKWG